jgi:probable lipoprotein NlpC
MRLFLALTFGTCLIVCGCKHRQSHAPKKEKVVKREHRNPAPKQKSKSDESEAWSAIRKTGIGEREINQSRLCGFIMEWYGVPYKYSGCQKTGIDCSCFANLLYERVYGKKISRTSSEMYAECDKLGAEYAQEGDLLFFKIGGNTISHVGVLVHNNYFVHSSSSKGVVINSLSEAYYKKYFFCAGRLRNV